MSYQFMSIAAGNAAGLWILIITSVGVVLVWGAIFGWDKWITFRNRQSSSPGSLFNDLCRMHRLRRGDTQLLGRILVTDPQANPAIIFVNPAILTGYAETHSAEKNACDSLLKKLFGELQLGQ